MSVHLNVQPWRLERGAYLYIRQSSMRQVLENTESAKRQYALRGRAIALGWREDQIVVIDNDQGESDASAVWREGFQRLVRRSGITIKSFSCALECKLQTVECLTLVGTEGSSPGSECSCLELRSPCRLLIVDRSPRSRGHAVPSSGLGDWGLAIL